MNYIDKSISKRKLKNFFSSLIEEGTDPHAIEMSRDGRLLVRYAIPPYNTKDKRQIFSLSKTFSATAFGLLYDRGLVRLDDKIVDYFPDMIPENPNENLLSITLHDVLTMNTGHSRCTLPSIARSDDGIRAFFECEVPYAPGSRYAYNSGAGYILGAIIKKLTGATMLDYLYEHFFMPLGVMPEKWQTSGNNRLNEGGIGLFISCEDAHKMGLVYQNKGIYNGKRILSEDWVKRASSYQVSTSGNGTGHWSAGYGYQIWLDANGGYRGDGAFGQFCNVIPSTNTVVTMLAESTATDKYFERLLSFADDCESDEGEDDFDFEKFTDGLYLPLYCEGTHQIDRYYGLDENPMGFTRLHIRTDDDALCLSFSDGSCYQTIKAGHGEWIESNIIAKNVKPVLTELAVPDRVEHSRLVASYKASDDGIIMAIRFLNAPHRGEWKIRLGDELCIDIEYRTAKLREDAYRISGKLIK